MVELAAGLERLGHDVTLVCHDFQPGAEFGASRTGWTCARSGPEGPDLLRGRAEFMTRYLVAMRRVAKLVPADVDVVNAHESRASAGCGFRCGAPWGFARLDAQRRDDLRGASRGCPTRRSSLTGESRRGWRGHSPLRSFATRGGRARSSSSAAVRSGWSRAAIGRRLEAEHFFDPPDRAQARRRLGVGDDTFLCVGAGILYPQRSFEDLIEALAQVRCKDRCARPWWIRPRRHGVCDRLARLIQDRGLEVG